MPSTGVSPSVPDAGDRRPDEKAVGVDTLKYCSRPQGPVRIVDAHRRAVRYIGETSMVST